MEPNIPICYTQNMTKYKIVGILNLFLGVSEIIYPLFALAFAITRLTTLYSGFSTEVPSFISIYLILGVVISMGAGNLFLGFNLVSKSGKKDKYFKYALILLIASFLLGGILSGIATLSIISPIYNLTSQF
jgi:hypothetical protein